jgi:hypothetical protein
VARLFLGCVGLSSESRPTRKNVLGAKRLFCLVSAFLHFPSFFFEQNHSPVACPDEVEGNMKLVLPLVTSNKSYI